MFNLLIGPITALLSKLIPDKDEAAKLAHEIATMAENHAHEISLAQIEVNKAEAASSSVFKGGWRPFIGWMCGMAFAWHFLVQPLLIFILVSLGRPLPVLPAFDIASLLTVLGGMLGLGSLRTFEKFKGITK